MTDVTTAAETPESALSAADEQLLRELTEHAPAGGLKLTGEGGLCEARPGRPGRREFPEWSPGQDGDYGGRPSGDSGSA